MNKINLLAFLMISSMLAYGAYTIDVDRSGTAYSTLSVEGGGQVEVPIPEDARGFRIAGGSYSISNGTAYVRPGQSGFCTFSFSTSLFTSKSDGGWKLSFSPPDGSDVRLYLPPYATLENSFPQPSSVSSDDSRMQLELPYSQSVSVYYKLGEAPVSVNGGSEGYYLIIGGVFVLALATLAAYFILRRGHLPVRMQSAGGAAAGEEGQRKPSLELTGSKKEMMETFNENDRKIADILLANAGKCRRNELERKSGISKSSLAMALNRLERRKIVEIDRTSTTHFVRLTDYFLRL